MSQPKVIPLKALELRAVEVSAAAADDCVRRLGLLSIEREEALQKFENAKRVLMEQLKVARHAYAEKLQEYAKTYVKDGRYTYRPDIGAFVSDEAVAAHAAEGKQ